MRRTTYQAPTSAADMTTTVNTKPPHPSATLNPSDSRHTPNNATAPAIRAKAEGTTFAARSLGMQETYPPASSSVARRLATGRSEWFGPKPTAMPAMH
jgi:hypothetical protein